MLCTLILVLSSPSLVIAFSPPVLENSSTLTHTLFLPLVLKNYDEHISPFGVQMYGPLNENTGLVQAAEVGADWIRWGSIAWGAVEPEDTIPDNYRWGSYDESILNATRAGLNLIVTICCNPSWAATYANGPIDKVDIGEFVEFVGTLVERYDGDGYRDAPGSPKVNYWEFYNEPDGGSELRARYGQSYWGHFGDKYAEMLKAVYPVIKAANPDAKVVIGGLAYDWFEDQGGPFVREFLDDVLRAGGGDYFDIMNFHYYAPFAPYWDAYGPGLVGKANYLRNKLAEYGIEKPIICTETGWHSNNNEPFPSSPQMQAEYVVKTFAQGIAARLPIVIWFMMVDLKTYPWRNGLITEELTPKPAYYAYQVARRELGRATIKQILDSTEDIEGYLFANGPEGKDIYVLWSKQEVTRTISLDMPYVKVIDLYGEVSEVYDGDDGSVDNRVEIQVGPSPIYIQGSNPD